MPPDTATRLVGRDAELSRILGMLTSASEGRGGALSLVGDPGIGKTALLRQAASDATGFQVLHCSGAEFEQEIPFAALHQLLRPLRDRLGALPEGQADVLRAALALGPASFGSRFGVGLVVLELLSRAATTMPVLVIVDDAHWLDRSTTEVVEFVSRRIETEQIALIAASRPPFLLRGVPTLELAGLAQADASELLRGLGRSASAATVDALVAATQGNPLALRELASRPTEIADVLHGLPPTLQGADEAFGRAVEQLTEGARLALLVAAAAGAEPASIVREACRQAGADFADLREAEAAGLVRVDLAGVEFAHPLVRSTVYGMAPLDQRRRVHTCLAAATRETNPDGGVVRRLVHAALGSEGPDDQLAGELEQAAYAAAGQRSFTAAMDLLQRSAALSVDHAGRARRTLAAAELALPAGRPMDAEHLLRGELLQSIADQTPVRRLEARLAIWMARPRPAIATLTAQAARSGGAERTVLLSEAALAAMVAGDHLTGHRLAQEAFVAAAGLEVADAAPAYLVQAFAAANVNQIPEATRLLVAAEPHLGAGPYERWVVVAASVNFSARRLERAAELFEQVVNSARSADAVELLVVPVGAYAHLELARGHWRRARALSLEALAIADLLDDGTAGAATRRGSALAALAIVDACRGDADACRKNVAEVFEIADLTATPGLTAHGHRALALLDVGSGSYAAAAERLWKVREICHSTGLGETLYVPFLADLCESLARSEGISADEPLAELEDTAARAGCARDRGLLLRCRALVTGGDTVTQLQEAREALREAGMTFEVARTDLLLGEAHRRAKRRGEATFWLQSAASTFEALGAAPWAARVRAELRSNGVGTAPVRGDPGRVELTHQELQVALIVAEGVTNAEAAGRLFLSTKTVEYHLANAYRKLGISRRSQLAAAIGH